MFIYFLIVFYISKTDLAFFFFSIGGCIQFSLYLISEKNTNNSAIKHGGYEFGCLNTK